MKRVMIALAMVLPVMTGCSSVISSIKHDQSHDTVQCEPDVAGGVFVGRRDCIIYAPNKPGQEGGATSDGQPDSKMEGSPPEDEMRGVSESPPSQ